MRTKPTKKNQLKQRIIKFQVCLGLAAFIYGSTGVISVILYTSSQSSLTPFQAVLSSVSFTFSVLFITLSYLLYHGVNWAPRIAVYLTLADIIAGASFNIASLRLIAQQAAISTSSTLAGTSNTPTATASILLFIGEFIYIYLSMTLSALYSKSTGKTASQKKDINHNNRSSKTDKTLEES